MCLCRVSHLLPGAAAAAAAAKWKENDNTLPLVFVNTPTNTFENCSSFVSCRSSVSSSCSPVDCFLFVVLSFLLYYYVCARLT